MKKEIIAVIASIATFSVVLSESTKVESVNDESKTIIVSDSNSPLAKLNQIAKEKQYLSIETHN